MFKYSYSLRFFLKKFDLFKQLLLHLIYIMINKNDDSVCVIKDLLNLNLFLNNLKYKIKADFERVEAARKLRELIDLHPEKYKLEYQTLSESNIDLVLYEKKDKLFFESWEEITRVSQLASRSNWPKEIK